MTRPQDHAARLRAAKIIHASLLLSVLLTVGVFGLVQQTASLRLPPEAGRVLIYVALGLAVLMLGAAGTLSQRVAPWSPGENESTWWRSRLSRLIVLWSVIEGVSLSGAVAWLLTGHWVPLMVVAAGILALFYNRPGRLLE